LTRFASLVNINTSQHASTEEHSKAIHWRQDESYSNKTSREDTNEEETIKRNRYVRSLPNAKI